MTSEKPQPPGKTYERENLYLSLKNIAVDNNISHNLSQPEDEKRLHRILCQPKNLQTQKKIVCTLLDFHATTGLYGRGTDRMYGLYCTVLPRKTCRLYLPQFSCPQISASIYVPKNHCLDFCARNLYLGIRALYEQYGMVQ